MSRRDPIDLAAVQEARASLATLADEHPELRGPSSPENRAEWEATLEETMAGAKTQDEQLVVRLSEELMERLDRYAETLRREQPGPVWRRSDVVRKLLAEALDAAGVKPKPKKRA